MDFFEEYPKLEAPQRDRFRRVITRLLSGHVLTPGSALRPDPDWRFAERYRDLVDGYLRPGGWRLDLDPGLQLCRAVHESGEQRVRFNKLESLVLCSLRLVYHEQMRAAGETDRCQLKVGELRERLIHAGRPAQQLSRRALADAVRKLDRHSLVEIDRGFDGHDAEVVTVSPLIEKVLPPDRIAELAERVRAYTATQNGSQEAEDTPDAGDATPDGESP